MPQGDGTGPRGQGPRTGRGLGGGGMGRGMGRGMRQGGGAGRMPAQPFGSNALKAVVDAEKCVACGACVSVCPSGAITVNKVASVSAIKCTGCGACVDVCGPRAISLRRSQ